MKKKIIQFLKKDSIFWGIAIGIILPLIAFGILYTISTIFAPAEKKYLIKLSNVIVVSVFTNLFTLRYYLLKLKFDRTGRGILLATFVLTIGYFATYSYIFE